MFPDFLKKKQAIYDMKGNCGIPMRYAVSEYESPVIV